MSETIETPTLAITPQPKYRIEDNLDFYKLLEEDDELDYNDANKCLITHDPLDNTAVTLRCNHSFNYMPLYKYVSNFKSRFNNMEQKSLKVSQIMCPFCRQVQNELLPLPPEGTNASTIHGVNAIEYSSILKGTCCYTETGVGSEEESSCVHKFVYLAHYDNKTYCFEHRGVMKKRWEKEQKKKHKCTYLFTRGVNKGIVCGKTITQNISCGLCVTHSKQTKQNKTKQNIDK
jgi:hypothetical protein